MNERILNEKDQRIFRSLDRLDDIGRDVQSARTRIERSLASLGTDSRGLPNEATTWLDILGRVDQNVRTTRLELGDHLYDRAPRNEPHSYWERKNTGITPESRASEDFRRVLSSTSHLNGPRSVVNTPLYSRYRTPNIDLRDEGREIVCRIELPGVNRPDLELQVSKDRLVLSTKVRTEKGHTNANDSYFADLELPTHVSPAKVQAKLDSGMLIIKMQKVDPTSGFKNVDVK